LAQESKTWSVSGDSMNQKPVHARASLADSADLNQKPASNLVSLVGRS